MGLKLWTSSTKRTRTTCPCEAALYEGLLACQEACLLCIISCKYCAYARGYALCALDFIAGVSCVTLVGVSVPVRFCN